VARSQTAAVVERFMLIEAALGVIRRNLRTTAFVSILPTRAVVDVRVDRD
jgi:hypothetical protein